MDVKIVWLTPEQNDRHYRALLAEKNEEIQTLKAGVEQRHALIEQQRVELDGLRQDVKTLKGMIRQKDDALAAKRWSSEMIERENAKLEATNQQLRKENARFAAMTPPTPTKTEEMPATIARLRDILQALRSQRRDIGADEDWATEREILDVIGLTRRFISKEAGFNVLTCILSRMKDDDKRQTLRAVGAYLGLDR